MEGNGYTIEKEPIQWPACESKTSNAPLAVQFHPFNKEETASKTSFARG